VQSILNIDTDGIFNTLKKHEEKRKRVRMAKLEKEAAALKSRLSESTFSNMSDTRLDRYRPSTPPGIGPGYYDVSSAHVKYAPPPKENSGALKRRVRHHPIIAAQEYDRTPTRYLKDYTFLFSHKICFPGLIFLELS